MADIRIKDLTTLESASLTGDVFVIDGTTGTRKLSAFSPTFGGNATVTGTLTVNSTSTFNNTITVSSNVGFIGKSGSGTGGNWRYISDDGTSRWLSGILGSPSETAFDIYDIVNGRSLLTLTAAGVVKVPQTTASTSTSSGALVVGNGTSGGLGVGGSVNVGGSLTVSGTSSLLTVANSTGSALLAAFSSAYASGSATPYVVIGSFSDPATSGARIAVSTDYSLDNRAAIQLQTRTTGGTLQTALTLANTRNATFAADVAISGTTASTSTSSGALVVSGGVGVAKSINAGALNESHTFTGGDTGSGTSIITCKGGLGATVFQVQGEGTTIVAGKLTANAASNAFGISTAQTPASASATGTTGTICWDTSYIYVCTATNTWKRVAISTW